MQKNGFLLLLLAAPLTCLAQPVPNHAAMVEHEVHMLEFIGGGSLLNPQERQQAAEVVDLATRAAPERWQQVDTAVQRLLNNIAQHNAPYNNALREQQRYYYQFPSADKNGWASEFVIEKKIVEAHDPVVALDAAHKRLVTAHMATFLRPAGEYVARGFALPPPRTDYDALVRRQLVEQLSTADRAIAEGLAHIERNAWYLPVYFDHIPEPKRTSFFANTKDKTFHNLGDPTSEQWQLAKAAGMMAAFAAQQSPSQGSAGVHAMLSERLLMQQMTLKAIQRAGMSGSPGCNVTVGSYSDRAARGCYPY